MKILIIVPAYNEEASIAGVITDIRAHFWADILVVNDGSTDYTANVLRAMRVPHMNLPFNLGIGGAMQAGYKYALEYDYDIAVQFDGDGQHIAWEIIALAGPVVQGDADMVIGSRFLDRGDYSVSTMRRLGIRFFAAALSSVLKQKITDPTSGFRAVNRKAMQFFAERYYADDYPEVESIVHLHYAGFRIVEKGVLMRPREHGQSSINALRSVYYMLKVSLMILFGIVKPPKNIKKLAQEVALLKMERGK
jgi:glycosyltransferase involved in cell wall biosynthesis